MIAVCTARLRYFDECWEGLRSEKCWVLRTASSSHWELFCILGPWSQRQDIAIWIWAWLPCEVWRTYSCIVCSAAALVQRMFRMDCEQGWLMQTCTVQYTAENGFTCFCLYKAQICLMVVGSGDSSVVRASDSWSKGPEFESRQERREKFLLQGQLSVLTLVSVSVPPLSYRSST